MIVSTTLPLPKLEPDNWQKWWDIWQTYKSPLQKRLKTPNLMSGLHVGFDIYRTSRFIPAYIADFVDFSVIYPTLLDQVMSVPVDIIGARFVMSLGDFPAHVDNHYPSWAIRNMFYYTEHNWYYTDINGNNRKELILPDNTNWWAYLDGKIKHGTEYNTESPKILLQLFTDPYKTKKYIETLLPSTNLETIEYYD